MMIRVDWEDRCRNAGLEGRDPSGFLTHQVDNIHLGSQLLGWKATGGGGRKTSTPVSDQLHVQRRHPVFKTCHSRRLQGGGRCLKASWLEGRTLPPWKLILERKNWHPRGGNRPSATSSAQELYTAGVINVMGWRIFNHLFDMRVHWAPWGHVIMSHSAKKQRFREGGNKKLYCFLIIVHCILVVSTLKAFNTNIHFQTL